MLKLSQGAALLLLLTCAVMAQPPGQLPGFPGGPFGPPKPGEVLPSFLQEQLKLTAEQKKQLSELQKDVDGRLGKILTAEQRKSLQDMREGPGGFGPPKGGAFGGPGTFPGGFGPMGGFATVRLDDVRKAIDATEEEWKVMGPKLQKVLTARQVLASEPRSADAKSAGTPRPGGVPGGGPGRGPNEVNVITQAHADFKAVLDNPKHTKAELREAADAVRKARDKARADLVAAQVDLRPLLTEDQQTILLGLGYLD